MTFIIVEKCSLNSVFALNILYGCLRPDQSCEAKVKPISSNSFFVKIILKLILGEKFTSV